MNRIVQLMALVFFSSGCLCQAALVLTGTACAQNFDSLGSGLPAGWSVYTGATADSLGSPAMFTSSQTYWSKTSGGYYNVASADGLNSGSDKKDQNNSTDRALGVRQVGSGGYDPGAAIALQIQNTAGLGSFTLNLEAQILNEKGRSTIWSFQYRIGDSGNFTTLGSFSDPNNWGSTPISFNSSQLVAWDNQTSDIWFRIAALDDTTGSYSRDMLAIDDFSLGYSPLNFSAVPEPAAGGLVSATVLLALCGFWLWRRRPSRNTFVV
jgi:MYXO-CTERM domain-containing protein